MSYILIAVIAVGIGIVLYVVLAPKLKHMQEGVWDITLETQLPDADTKITVSLSQELTKTNPVPNIELPGYECRLQERRHMFFVIGDTVYWRVYCKGENEFQGSAKIKYNIDRFSGKIQMRTINDEKGQRRFDLLLTGTYKEPAGSGKGKD
ncbi:hypothetical protein ACFL6F_01720 [Planctomycetota bacterium]